MTLTNSFLFVFFFCLVVDFFNRINLIYGTISEYCNETTCPTMSGGSRYEYLWADGDTWVILFCSKLLFVWLTFFCYRFLTSGCKLNILFFLDIKNQHHWLHRNTLNCSWTGSNHKLTMKIVSQFRRVCKLLIVMFIIF